MYDEVPEIYGVEVRISGAYQKVAMPLGEKFSYELTDNETIVRLEKLEVHSVIELGN